jgi:3-hydroxybutyryl-CoA dehydratase
VAETLSDPPDRTFEDFALGDVIETRGRTLDAADFTAFAGLTGDHYPLHIDEEFCKGTRFGARIAHGPLTQSIAIGLVGMTGYYGNGIVALLELRRLRALAPVFAGDTIRVRAEVTGHDEGESPRYGQLTVTYHVLNQKEEKVMEFEQVMLSRRRPQEGGNVG